MDYTLRQLQVFLKIAQTQSITKAAEELYLSQPAVSIQLKNFQEQFEIPLTEVVGRKLFITDFGKEIAIAAENILNEVYKINYKTLAHKGQMSGRLKLSVVSTANPSQYSLNGDNDEEYQIIVRTVNSYNGVSDYGIRLNNDTATNYGFQYVYGLYFIVFFFDY